MLQQRSAGAHALPQPSQFSGSLSASTSQPLPKLPSQSSRLPLQFVIVHAPAEQATPVTNAPGTHAVLHAPQCATSDVRSISQPSVAMPLQSPRPGAQACPQAPAEHVATVPPGAGQAVLHAPQLAGSVATAVSHPSIPPLQSANPGEHSRAHAPPRHTGRALGAPGHALSHRPQCATEIEVSTQLAPQVVAAHVLTHA